MFFRLLCSPSPFGARTNLRKLESLRIYAPFFLLHQSTGLPYSSVLRRQSSTADSSVASTTLFEEETLPNYHAEYFHPVRIGEKLNVRYVVLGKLGYGASAKAWLCRDLNNNDINNYVVVKIQVSTPMQQLNREQVAYDRLAKITQQTGAGRCRFRTILDSFRLGQSDGRSHLCLVHEPLQTSLYSFQRFGGVAKPLPEVLAKSAIRYLLETLDFLHANANIAHCDIKLSNIMLGIEDPSVLSDFEDSEKTNPSSTKIVDGTRTIYATRQFRPPKDFAFGPPVLCDLGEARIRSSHEYQEIQPEVYKAPEILMQFGWNHSVDIWNLGCVVWDTLEVDHLFDGYDEEGYHNNRVHVGEMVSLLGEPPQEFLRRSPNTWRLFDENGRWKRGAFPSRPTLESRIRSLNGRSKAEFIDFLRSMVC